MPNHSQSTRPQPLSLSQQTIALTIDAALLTRVERLGRGDRQQAITAALQLWCEQQEQKQHHNHAQQRQAKQERDETGWLI
ncbi:MAG: hypothetical protein HC910_13845 [Spirulinaceae cyanobacterium SM2_1_0]|nr:hypothetical protein [Spirulinaceae cyanobacterium SM2_1_0]